MSFKRANFLTFFALNLSEDGIFGRQRRFSKTRTFLIAEKPIKISFSSSFCPDFFVGGEKLASCSLATELFFAEFILFCYCLRASMNTTSQYITFANYIYFIWYFFLWQFSMKLVETGFLDPLRRLSIEFNNTYFCPSQLTVKDDSPYAWLQCD